MPRLALYPDSKSRKWTAPRMVKKLSHAHDFAGTPMKIAISHLEAPKNLPNSLKMLVRESG
jgi:hypothetical protein